MLGWLLLGALLTAAVITICVSYLDKKVAKEKLKEKSITLIRETQACKIPEKSGIMRF